MFSPHPSALPSEASTLTEDRQAVISELLPHFLTHLQYELRRAPGTIQKYRDCLICVVKVIGDIPPAKIRAEHVLAIKAHNAKRNLSASRIQAIIVALKGFLTFCQSTVGLTVIDPSQIRLPRIPKREVTFLTPEEVRQFVSAIPIRKSPRRFDLKMLCFRALVEVLLGTGMRISEATSIKRSTLNLETGEARIVGKGNKERTVFFTPRALSWVKEYLARRTDHCDALFMSTRTKPLRGEVATVWFRRFRSKMGIQKRITPHILRHTVATTLLFNGCPIGHIKEILGHENLLTTCKFYLGTDKRAAKEAHTKYLDYEPNVSQF
ncbi:MAG TPA: tyrosine-type recombinase/integrase [Terriglobia bacterium]|nr:tyrosine-type recombinase/integrase [Terriglobia bacterium]